MTHLFQGKVDYDHWLAQPGVLARVLQESNHPFHPCVDKNLVQAVMYNSISMDMVVGPVAKVEKIEDQLELFVDYARNFGVPQVNVQHRSCDPVCECRLCLFQEFLFDPVEDLMLLKDIPKVTRCLALMAKMANVKEFENVTIENPDETESDQDDMNEY